MQVKIFDTIDQASQYAFERIETALKQGATSFGLATGGTPEPLYQLLRQSDLDFSHAYAINLDEYYGLAADHPKSYATYMRQHLFDDKPFKATFIPDGSNPDVKAETQKYEAIIAQHPIDLQILGIGRNGHIGFNEPGTAFDSTTALVDLTPSTIQANQRYFPSADQVPTQAYSMGIGTIMKAKEIILLAFGEKKAQAIAQVVRGHVSLDNPATVLNHHPNVTLVLDKAAASLIPKESID